MAPHWPASLLTEMLAGQLMTGFSLSFTVTVNEQLAVFPLASVTTKVLVVTPTGKVDPLARPEVCCMLVAVQLSAKLTE
jgi:hypothetical protein